MLASALSTAVAIKSATSLARVITLLSENQFRWDKLLNFRVLSLRVRNVVGLQVLLKPLVGFPTGELRDDAPLARHDVQLSVRLPRRIHTNRARHLRDDFPNIHLVHARWTGLSPVGWFGHVLEDAVVVHPVLIEYLTSPTEIYDLLSGFPTRH